MSVKVRFAPSPTGKVHIGNIRAAIFNYLFARHHRGEFVVRVEDTDIERSTKEAIDALFYVLDWMGLDYDGEPLYQSSQANNHLAAAKSLLEQGDAYYHAKGGGEEVLLYRIPWNSDGMTGIETVVLVTQDVANDVPVVVNATGIRYATVSKKGKVVEQEACLAGFKDLNIVTSNGEKSFSLNDHIDEVLDDGKEFVVENPISFSFTRRTIGFTDLVKGELAKPLDSMKDFVIVRSNGTPIFHLSNVCDDITQEITHIIRGDDHVENTYRHLLMFQSLGSKVPQYAHLPMIVNKEGKPYSKRDGDAFVGDFREKGFLSAALFNYLALLGWSPGDDREKLCKDELVAEFSLDRVKITAAQMDMAKLAHLNGTYVAALPLEAFIKEIKMVVEQADWFNGATDDDLEKVAKIMQSRTILFTDALSWKYFFSDDFEYDDKAFKKNVESGENLGNLKVLASNIAQLDMVAPESLGECLKGTVAELGVGEFKLHQPLRVALTGTTQGADILEVASFLGKDKILVRLKRAELFVEGGENGSE